MKFQFNWPSGFIRCLKMLTDDGPRVTGILISSGELKRNVPDYKLLANNRNILTDFKMQHLGNSFYTTFTNLSMKYLVMCKVYTDVGGIK